jgi:cytochrome c-type biogenesis protein CcmE
VSKGRIVVALAIIAGGLGWVLTRQLSTSLIYYRTPTELLGEGREAIGQSTRLGGYVLPGSVRHDGDAVLFVVSDETTRMSVVATGSIPALFKEGQGVVLEGHLGGDGKFHADTVLVKHSGVYTPPTPGETPHSADLAGDG